MREVCAVAVDAGPSLGSILRRLRLGAGFSQEVLAERARMSVDAISALERGTRRSPQRATLALLIEALALDGDARAQLEAAARRPADLRRGDAAALPAARRALLRNSNVPFPLTSFVGRETECAMLAQRLATDRLLTLAGTGGVGKTRLAVEIGHAVLARFADGVWLVELAGLRDAALIVPAICTALGVREVPGTPLADTLLAALEPSEHLLIVDNCEHLLDAVAPLLQRLLTSCARLRAIATSREPLRVNGERIHRVAPLAFGAVDGDADREPAAVRLFVDRAQAVDGTFEAVGPVLEAVRTIVRRLDGLPLAIELAAARVEVLPATAIAERLDRRLALLTSGMRTALPHQVTMRALIDWSYDQLEPLEQIVLRRLAVFSGGWTLEALETIVADRDVGDADTFRLLTRLHDKSLVVAEPQRRRFRLLETIREYAAEKLDEAGERERFVGLHAAYFLDYAGRTGKELRGPGQPDALVALTAEIENVRAALNAPGAFDDGPARANAALAAMTNYWYLTGAYAEGHAQIEASLARSSPPSPELANAYFQALPIALSESRFDDARRFAAAATAANAGSGDAVLDANIAAGLLLTDILDARPVAAERIAALRATADRLAHAEVLESAATAQGFAAVTHGDAVAAQGFFEEALSFARVTGDPSAIAGTSLVLARLALIRTAPARAAHLLADAVPVLAARENLSALASALDGVVVVAETLGDAASAAFALGAGRRMHRLSGTAPPVHARPVVSDDVVARLRATLGVAGFDERVALGERAFPGDAVEAVRAFRDALV